MFGTYRTTRACLNCGATYLPTSGTQRVCPTCRPRWKRILERVRDANSQAMTRDEYVAACHQMRAAREAAYKAETPGEVEFYTRKWESLERATRPYAEGRRSFADGSRAHAALMALG